MRIVMIPRMPPVMTTHVLGDIATATRIESTAKTTSVSSTRTTVAQNALRPSHAVAGLMARRSSAPADPKKWLYERYRGTAPPIELHPGQGHQVHGGKDGEDPESKGPEDAVAQRLVLLAPRETEDENRQHQRVVRAQQALEQDQQADRDEIRDVNVHAGPAQA